MSTEEDECDSSSPLAVASQADITSYLRTRADQITGLDISMSDIDDIEDDDDDDDETSMDGSLVTRFAQVPSPKTIHRRKARSVASTSSCLSQSCFASISPNKGSASDDLTELKWLNTFKFKDHLINQPSKEKPLDSAARYEYRVSQFISDLKTHQSEQTGIQPASYAVWIFLACYSMRDDKRTPWSLTMKQLYEYIQSNIKSAAYQRGWKNLLRQALLTVPCFIQKKDETAKARSLWTIDPYYRPSLIRAYNSNASLATQKSPVEASTPPTTDQVTTPSLCLINHFPPKATVKTKALPRLYERLCGEKSLIEDETDFKLAHSSERKRPRSMSLLEARSTLTSNESMANEASATRTRKSKKQGKTLTADHSPIESTLSKESPIVTPSPSLDHSYSNRVEPSMDDERDSSSSVHSKEIDVKNTGINHRRKPSPPKKRVPLVIPSHRANTRISRRIIEQDLRLLHQSALASSSDQQPLDLSKDSSH